MNLILSILGAVVLVIVLLKRLADAGIDLGGRNPFSRKRERTRDWPQVYEGEPVYQLEDPMEVTALLMAAVAGMEGGIDSEQERELLSLFENVFHLSSGDAGALLSVCTRRIQDGKVVTENVFKILAPSLDAFTAAQANSCLELMEQAAGIDNPLEPVQQEFIDEVATTLQPRLAPASKWG